MADEILNREEFARLIKIIEENRLTSEQLLYLKAMVVIPTETAVVERESKNCIKEELIQLGMRPGFRGFDMLVEAINMVVKDRDALRISKVMLPKLAKRFNTTVSKYHPICVI